MIRPGGFPRQIAGIASLLLVAPVLRFLLLPVFPALGPAHAPPPATIQGGLGAALAGSAMLAASASLVATPVALWIGFMLERRNWRGRALLAASLWVLFVMPVILVASGWQVVLAELARSRALAADHAGLGWPVFILLTALKGLPAASFACRIGIAASDPLSDDAARLNVRTRVQRLRLAAHEIVPFASAAFVIVFIESIQDFGLASVFGGVLPTKLLVSEIYRSIALWPVSWTRAAEAADLLAGLAACACLLRFAFTSRSRPNTNRRVATGRIRTASATEARCGIAATLMLATLAFLIPLAGFTSNLARSGGGRLPEGAVRALDASVLYASLGALIALVLAAMLLAGGPQSRGAAILSALPLANMAVPGVVLGAAWVMTFDAAPDAVSGTPLGLVLADAAGQLPLLLLILGSVLGRQDGAAGEAARLHGIGWLDRLELIHLPPLAKPLALGWLLAFCRIFFELPLAMMLAPPGGEPAGVVMLQLQQALEFGALATFGLACLGICGVVAAAVLMFAGRIA